MKILANRKIKALFYKILLCIMGFSLFLAVFLQLGLRHTALYIGISAWGMGSLIMASCYGYFKEQNEIMENAAKQVREYIAGNKDARIECCEEGELYRLFHEVNTLAAILSGHIESEGKKKIFLKNLISDISHQLKTPLAALNIYIGILLGEAENQPTVKEFARLSEQELERIETLVQNLLKISKFDAGTIVMEKTPENISEMMERIKTQFSFRAGREGKDLVLSGDDAIDFVCDRNWLMEAVINIVKNALDHTGNGGTVRIRTDDCNDYPQPQRCAEGGPHPAGIGRDADRSEEVRGMNNYLSLIPISARVNRRQNRMTLLCIMISVFLVTAMFSVADMFIRSNSAAMQEKHGNWHIRIDNISQDTAEEIGRRPDVSAVGWLDSFNVDGDQPYEIGRKKAALYGTDAVYLTQLANGLEEGRFPENDNEVILSSNAKLAMDAEVGGRVTVHTPAGDADFTISGFGSDDKAYYQEQTYLVGVYLTLDSFRGLMAENGIGENKALYVKFQNVMKASKAGEDIRRQYNPEDGSISENIAVMGVAGQSGDQSVKNIYGIAAVLFMMVLLAGVLMISGSLNSNVAQRTKFFGMMRCIGASRGQIIRFVRMEALNWCKTAVPAGLLLGTLASFGICAYLRYGIGGEFAAMQVFALSPAGLGSGVLIGTSAVLLAAQAPAKRAAKVSPASAVSGNEETISWKRGAIKGNIGRVESALGIHHAAASGKNLFLMTSSFALTIILALCFSIGLDFAQELLPSLKSWQPDLTLNGYANAPVLEQEIEDDINRISGVEHTFGTSYQENLPVVSSRQGIGSINLESYDEGLLDSAKDEVVEGDLSDIYGDSGKAAIVYYQDNPLKVGDTILIAGQKVEIACSISAGLFPEESLVICSKETFERLTGEQRYTMIGVLLNAAADDETVRQISRFAGSDVIFSDVREQNRQSNTTYMATKVCIYGFLAIIGMVTMFYIMNTISISAASRTKQYGVMRAVGMDAGGLTRMIAAEMFTYALSGLIVGVGIGLPLRYFLHVRLLTRYFGMAWHMP